LAGDRQDASGLLAIVVATLAFSTGAILIKSIAMSPTAIVFWRLVIGVAVLVPVALALGAPRPRRLGAIVAAGLVFGLHQIFFFAANKLTSIAIVTLVGALQPLLVSMVSRRTIGEPVPPGLRLWSVVAVAGVAIVVHANWGDASRHLSGDLLAIGNLVLFTAYFLMMKRIRHGGEPTLTSTIAIFVVGGVVVAPVLLVTGEAGLGASLPPTTRDLVLLVVLTMVPGNGHLLVNWAHPRVSAALSSLVLTGMPLLASIWAHLAFGEPYGWRHVLGMLLVAAAVEGGRRAERRYALALEIADEPAV
jgi:drug/metabolite transporter (DMT)-like permease